MPWLRPQCFQGGRRRSPELRSYAPDNTSTLPVRLQIQTGGGNGARHGRRRAVAICCRHCGAPPRVQVGVLCGALLCLLCPLSLLGRPCHCHCGASPRVQVSSLLGLLRMLRPAVSVGGVHALSCRVRHETANQCSNLCAHAALPVLLIAHCQPCFASLPPLQDQHTPLQPNRGRRHLAVPHPSLPHSILLTAA